MAEHSSRQKQANIGLSRNKDKGKLAIKEYAGGELVTGTYIFSATFSKKLLSIVNP